MAPIVTFALLAASLLGVMSAPVSHDAKVDVVSLHTRYAGIGTIGTGPFHDGTCGDIEYSSSHAVIAISAAPFGNSKHKSSTSGKYVKANRGDSESTHYMYKVVDICEENSLLFSDKAWRQFSNQDAYRSCEVDFFQDEAVIVLNEAQRGEQRCPDYQCFKKIRVSVKGDPSNSVVVRVVDTCPRHYCSYGQLDLSQVAFGKFAPMPQGVFLEYSFV
ncbi:hypothetical protein BGX30_010665 [Mortierella sp. GBA39]|nr:hypothetical protein BGX30_010665 [Mortierella sp. GBA39]